MGKAGDTPVKPFSIDLEKGLNSEEVQKRLKEYGYNEVPRNE